MTYILGYLFIERNQLSALKWRIVLFPSSYPSGQLFNYATLPGSSVYLSIIPFNCRNEFSRFLKFIQQTRIGPLFCAWVPWRLIIDSEKILSCLARDLSWEFSHVNKEVLERALASVIGICVRYRGGGGEVFGTQLSSKYALGQASSITCDPDAR